MHFKTLNSKIKPFAHRLRVPVSTEPWPSVQDNHPRRVSVNSFGFGGTNAHAIIESYSGQNDSLEWELTNGHTSPTTPEAPYNGLFALSANSGSSLSASAEALADFLDANPDTDLDQLAFNLFRRAEFAHRATFYARDVANLVEELRAGSEALKSSPRAQYIPDGAKVRILGVFTGQGAQWASMGKELLAYSKPFRGAIKRMQLSLDVLPEGDRPDWTLTDQLIASSSASRVGEAAISQPLCTALQVALVDVLRAAGVEFSAVIGHSSGEIGAAYAAGYISAEDAIRIAYYRGVHSGLAMGADGKRGKMMAVGLTYEQATAYCSAFNGSLVVAASNSPTSCTLAGDAVAVDKAFVELQADGTFARVLKVDTAYHSPHMKLCGGAYLDSITKCAIKVENGQETCKWFSSVWGLEGRGRKFVEPELKGQYWVDNMTGAVLFSEALTRALQEGTGFDLALEVGPHPALKGPSLETIKQLSGANLPYAGVLKRGQDAVESFTDLLGLLWKSFLSSQPIITFDRINLATSGDSPMQRAIIKNLPRYSWDHNLLIWRESRSSRAFRTQPRPRHELLGHASTLGERQDREVQWKQLLRLSELPWLAGHKIQGEVLFPASGYLSMAFEAAIHLLDDGQSARLLELSNVEIIRAMRLEEDSPGLEVAFTIRVTAESDDAITAEVACYSGSVDSGQAPDAPVSGLTAHFTASVKVWFGEPLKDALPTRSKPLLSLESLDMTRLYSSLAKEGFNYTGYFQAKSMLRRLNRAAVSLPDHPVGSKIRPCMHPTVLDTAFHGLLAAFAFPEDGRLGSIFLPTRIECVRISMIAQELPEPSLIADAAVVSTDSTTLTGDIDIFHEDTACTEVQMRGVRLTAVGRRPDPWLYADTKWLRDATCGIDLKSQVRLSDEESLLYERLSRTAYFFLRTLQKKIRPQELLLMGKYRKHMMKWVNEHLLPQIEAGEHHQLRPEWKEDTLEMIQEWRASYPPDNNDMNILHAIGTNLVNIVRGIIPPLRILTENGMLDRLYTEGVGVRHGNIDLGAIVSQIAHQHPRMQVLEVGAGTGGTTRTVLDSLDGRYSMYTYTDISTGFFENARTIFSQHINKLAFKTLNIENDPIEQGFKEEAYDMIVSSNCLHATHSLENTLRQCRRLLKPGGRLVLLEVTEDFLPTQLIMSTLPGWFLGIEDGRVWAPTVSVQRWDELLRACGFSGVDFSTSPSYCSAIIAQAVDETIKTLRAPLKSPPAPDRHLQDIVVICGDRTQELANSVHKVLQDTLAPRMTTNITVVPGIQNVDIPAGAAVLCLADLDEPVFRHMGAEKFQGLKDIVGQANAALWVTTGAKSGREPDANVTVGLSSALLAEHTTLKLQFLDVEDPTELTAENLAEMLIRLAIFESNDSGARLWTQEPELWLKDGAVHIPRVSTLDAVNRRSLARIRHVSQTVNLSSSDEVVVLDETKRELQIQNNPDRSSSTTKAQIRVSATSDRALDYGQQTRAHLFIGQELSSGDKILGLVDVPSSLVSPVPDRILHRWSPEQCAVADTVLLAIFLRNALAEHLLQDLEISTWIHEVPDDLQAVLDARARRQKLNLLHTTSDMANRSSVNFIHPYMNQDDLQRLFPNNLRMFVDLSTDKNSTLIKAIRSSTQTHSVIEKHIPDLTIGLDISKLRTLAGEHIGAEPETPLPPVEVVDVGEIPNSRSKPLGLTSVIDWTTTDVISAAVQPLEHFGLFSDSKTYLLCGMTGDLGISVCAWMVANGARNVVLTSRNPHVSNNVLEFFSRKGATVRPMSADITNMESLRQLYAEINATMPPIGGVMNAAMVLRDRLFQSLTWEDFEAVLKPKVTGSQNLNELFGNQDLEFFICFSSTTSIVGSIGQSAYAAANHYMVSLIQQRRDRGLAGSVLHISILTGFGYIFRRDAEHADTIYKSILPRCERQSEADLHGMLAEAIVCGHPGQGQVTELITGARPVFQEEWREDPRLSCYSGLQQLQDDDGKDQAVGTLSVKAQLAAVDEPSEYIRVLMSCFAFALGNLLEIDPEKVDSQMSVSALGIDSLVAIRIREWFLRETGVDVPVLKVMSDNYSVSRLCDDVLAQWQKLSQP
jgi:acyl transferase domain-containing protein/NADP-dependent 3-hydroxy acid dehydrogenase YdfG